LPRRGWLIAVIAAALALLPGAALAHSPKVLVGLEATADDPGGPVRVAVSATYPDGHRPGGLTAKVVARLGSRRVAVPLRPGSRRGTWTGSADLGPGRWALTATITGDAEGTATRPVRVAEPPSSITVAPQPGPSAAPVPAVSAVAVAPGPGRTPGTTAVGAGVDPVLGGLIALLAVAAVAGLAITRLRRGRND
jgi:hypothetical protein